MPNNGSNPLQQQQQQQKWSPFVGPRSFRRDIEEQKLFFGRTYETERIISLIYSHKLVLVYAESGAGKTSIFNASIIPTLEQRNFEVSPVARVGIGSSLDDKTNINAIRTTTVPSPTNVGESRSEFNPYIFNAFQSLLRKQSKDPSLFRNISLSQFLSICFPHKVDQKRGRQIPQPQVLVFDQLEELFNLYVDPDKWQEQQKDFFKQIVQALEKDPLLRVVLIIREDYLAQLDPFADLLPEKLKPRFRLERLHKDAAIEAIRGPLEKAKAYVNDERIITKLFDEGIIDKLIEDLLKIRVETFGGRYREINGEYVEPIQLQVVCQRLWNKLIQSKVEHISKDYFEHLGDVDKALEDFYVDAINEASKKTRRKEEIIRKWFEEKLITSSGTRSVVHRGVEFTGGLSNKVVNVLENKYLIRKEERSGAQWYELTHDRLIKPIKDSNKKWRDEERKKRSRRNKVIIIPSTVVAVVAIILILLPSSHPLHFTRLGNQPGDISVNPSTNKAYVVNYGSNSVSVLDSNNVNKVVANITVGKNPSAISVNPSTNIVYVADHNDNKVSVINGTSNSVITTIPVGKNPSGVSVDPSTNMIYVTNFGDNTVSVIDGRTDKVVDIIPTIGCDYNAVTVNKFTNIVYVVSADCINVVSVVNGANNRVIANVTVGNSPQGISVNPSTNIIYVANHKDNAVSVINGTTNSVITTIPVGKNPWRVSVNPLTNMIYVANRDSNTVSVINGTTNSVITTIPVGKDPQGISINPSTNVVYVANSISDSIYVIDGKTNKLINTVNGSYISLSPPGIRVGRGPDDISVNPLTNMIYVGNYDDRDHSVSVINGLTNRVKANVTVVRTPYGISVNPLANLIYVANRYSCPGLYYGEREYTQWCIRQNGENHVISVINGTTNRIIANVTVDNDPYGVSVNPLTNMIYVANGYDRGNTVSVINGTTNVVTSVTVNPNPTAVSVNPLTNMIYVANRDSNTVSVINGTTSRLVTDLTVGYAHTSHGSLSVNPLTNMIYVANHADNTVSVIDGKTDTSILTIPVGLSPNAVSVNSITNMIYVVNSDNTVSVINGTTNRVVITVPVGSASGVSVNPITNMIYVVNNGENTVSVINGTTNRVVNPYDPATLTAISEIYNGHHSGGALKLYDKVLRNCKNSVPSLARNNDADKRCELAVLAK